MKKQVLLVLTDMWADWEAAYTLHGINMLDDYEVKTVAADGVPKTSMGGLRVEIDCTIESYTDFSNTVMVILPGGMNWKESRHDEIADFVKKAISHNIPIAAICGATMFLGKHGFLDNVKHTGDDLEFFTKEEGYNGQNNYIAAQIVSDGGFITANETAALEFAKDIWNTLKIYKEEEVDAWYTSFKNGMVQ